MRRQQWARQETGPLGLLIEVFRGLPPNMPRALCAGVPEVFDAVNGSREDIDRAKAICRRCPERAPCHQHARRNRKRLSGVWAGTYYRQKGDDNGDEREKRTEANDDTE